jgi:uncharacterized protein (DUF885 family)
MRSRYFVVSTIFFIFLNIHGFSQAEEPAKTQKRITNTSSQIIKNVADAYWQRTLSESLYLRTKYGLDITSLPDLSYEKGRSDLNFASSLYAQLKRAKKPELTHAELLSYSILEWDLLNTMQSFQYFWLNFPVTPYASQIPTVHLAFTSFQFSKESDLESYLNLLEKYPEFIGAIQKHLEHQVKMKIVLPTEEVDQVVPFLNSYVQEPSQSLFFVQQARLSALSEEKIREFQSRITEVIESKVNPSLKNLTNYLDGDYRKEAPSPVGLSQYPKGKDYYRVLVRYHTTMDVTPEEVHQTGLDQVKRIMDRMQQVRDSLGFKGTKEEFHTILTTDPRFIPKTPDEIGQKLMAFQDKILPKIDSYFLHKPKAPYGVKRLDPALEGSMTFGYYQVPTKADPKGYYYYNGSNLKERTLMDAGSLIYHELVPGHHFQLCLQSENENLPDFRKNGGQTAYVEGWAEYASDLADEMGMYEDPYDLYGRLRSDLFLTVRLVVDTGMNYLGWPRSKGVEYMKENTFLSDTQIQTESLRYSTDIPGQALGYKMGSRKIQDLRKKCQEALKDKFDIRKFHDAVLGTGSMPMAVLEKHMDWFIESEKTTASE